MMLLPWLKRPYPLLESDRSKWGLATAFAGFTYVFLLLYQPFGATEIDNKPGFLLGFGLSVWVSLLFNYLALPRLLPKWFDALNWQIWKEVLYISWSFLLIASLNYLYNVSIGASVAPQHSWLEFVGITFSVGIFPLLIMIFLMELRLSKKNQLTAKALVEERNQRTQSIRAPFPTLKIESETQNEPPLLLSPTQFLFATSDSNYTTVFFQRPEGLQKQLMRVSLKSVEKQLAAFPNIVRCHRSYLVNTTRIQDITGNARSLNIRMEGYEGLIPVSRSFPKERLL